MWHLQCHSSIQYEKIELNIQYHFEQTFPLKIYSYLLVHTHKKKINFLKAPKCLSPSLFYFVEYVGFYDYTVSILISLKLVKNFNIQWIGSNVPPPSSLPSTCCYPWRKNLNFATLEKMLLLFVKILKYYVMCGNTFLLSDMYEDNTFLLKFQESFSSMYCFCCFLCLKTLQYD